MAERDPQHPQHLQRRSSSRTSSASRHSQRAKAACARPQKRLSASSNATTTDLTSFPSLSPDRSPDGFLGQPALNRALTNALLDEEANESPADVPRDRRSTLAKLTGGLPAESGRAALFDDSIHLHDFPGALHLADDSHIERLVASTGAVKLVRQFARDLALRDAEISALRQRADARERELKRMLREVAVSNQDIERRLYALENAPRKNSDGLDAGKDGEQAGQRSVGVHGLMQQALTDEVGSLSDDGTSAQDQATVRGTQRLECDSPSGTSSAESGTTRKRQLSVRGWQDYIFGNGTASRKTSRASSIMSGVGEVEEEETQRRRPSNRRKALDEQLFQPPSERAGPSGGEVAAKRAAGDDASIHSRKSSKSLASWTVKLFAGGSQPVRDENTASSVRSRASSIQQDKSKSSSSASSNPRAGMSAVAALKRINSNTNFPSVSGRPANGSTGTGRSTVQPGRRHAASTVSQPPGSDGADKSATNLGPVEMDAILPMESRPPTLSYMYNNYQSGELLTDRFGFIYDQRRKKRQREAIMSKNSGNRLSVAETLSSFRTDASDGDDDDDEQVILKQLQAVAEPQRSPPSISPDDPDAGAVSLGKWQDYLKIPTRPTELLSHTPSAGPIVSLTTASESQPRTTAVAVDRHGSLSVNPNAPPSASTSTIVADRPEFAGGSTDELTTITASSASPSENEPVRLLLEQLTELHDTLQRDRTVRWNEFMRKVRAERRKEGEAAAAAAASARSSQSVDTPEASLPVGEVVGISNLGNKGKVGRAKWREFRSLVLGGIPVALRAKIWSECSGASSMRVPGYYDDLVRGIGGTDPDPSVVAQIDMDINRTLTDNVFFRKGPGVSKLREVLLAYSRRNAEVGYCQGMNLIAASLLLITPTAEDAFWILVSMIENILPHHYYDHGLLASRADQVVLRQYISEVLPNLSAHLDSLGVELEALTFQWFLSIFTDCLSAEALYRVWDVVLCLNVTSVVNPNPNPSAPSARETTEPSNPSAQEIASGSGGGSTFLFQVALALLKLNEQQLLTTCSTPAELYTYINHQMTNHAISIDGLIQASEALRNVVRREDVVARRAEALHDMREFSTGLSNAEAAGADNPN
ncbi:TBC domain-containing protein [Aspergillus clavatus NRRL 1]|uniref:TBC domain protein, putative n=1 Tax=Aspergillus clavatus (strain ATCC 1007 / CBS 513.65 / DSM 816 / NCTC 3887 / NRRL 1 / QM 1276 / 107) TaxID=344612 RepID=A1CU07_ASPCL|nr:TBC domain protein, putative [Aspergillus clavatus NRRL 1]EAW06794.1 TBC domain protein, putative [Aspergillus clavatus NRRL 1]